MSTISPTLSGGSGSEKDQSYTPQGCGHVIIDIDSRATTVVQPKEDSMCYLTYENSRPNFVVQTPIPAAEDGSKFYRIHSIIGL